MLPNIANNNFTNSNNPPSSINFSMNNNTSPKNRNINKFTLTDHFKNYHKTNNKYIHNSPTSDQRILTTENDINDGLSSDERSSLRTNDGGFLEFKRNFEEYGVKNKLTELIKKKGYFHNNDMGKK